MPQPPKPAAQRRRRNITGVTADRNVPIGGRKGPIPKPPLILGDHGKRFWQWAWRTPQSTTWHVGVTYPLAMLAQLVDEYELADNESHRTNLGRRIDKALTEFGLTPRAMAAMHLTAVDEEQLGPEPLKMGTTDNELALRRRAKSMGSATG